MALSFYANPRCRDCRVDTQRNGEYYMVHDEIWALAGLDVCDGMLCIGCLERRLDRELTRADFPDVPINQGFFPQSQRFLDRLGRLGDPELV